MLNIIGFALIIVVTVFAYKTAKEYQRSAIGWTAITFVAGISIQIILPIFIVILIAIAMRVSGSSVEQQKEAIPIFTISAVCVVLSVVAGFLIVRYLAKIPEEKPFDTPPAPLNFNQPS